MGFLDRLKKKKEQPEREQQQPLVLEYRDGTVASVFFNGACEVDGKTLHLAQIQYLNQDGSFIGRNVLLEPITALNQDGQRIDATEEYYKEMAYRDGTIESHAAYGAVKGFFKKEEITEQKMGSNYIGNVAQKENGEFYRHFDEGFKARYIRRSMEEKQAQMMARQQQDEKFLQDLRNNVNNIPVNYKTSHAEILTPEKNPYSER